MAEVREAERLGYGVDRGTLFSGVVSIGVVIRDRAEAPIYGLTASTIGGRTGEERIAEVGARMVELARSLAR